MFDAKDLWKALDRDDDHMVRLEELSPMRSQQLARSQVWCNDIQCLHGVTGFWGCQAAVKARNRRRPGGITSNQKMKFVAATEALKELGWPEVNDKEARNMLLTSLDFQGCGYLTLADFKWLDGWH